MLFVALSFIRSDENINKACVSLVLPQIKNIRHIYNSPICSFTLTSVTSSNKLLIMEKLFGGDVWILDELYFFLHQEITISI